MDGVHITTPIPLPPSRPSVKLTDEELLPPTPCKSSVCLLPSFKTTVVFGGFFFIIRYLKLYINIFYNFCYRRLHKRSVRSIFASVVGFVLKTTHCNGKDPKKYKFSLVCTYVYYIPIFHQSLWKQNSITSKLQFF